jgi:AcrR family transcriptional regulator
MRARPVEEVTVGDITSAADVGHGTFYLHFKSKYEVLIPITRDMAERWDQTIQASLADSQDPAEVVGLSTRYMGRAVNADPLWSAANSFLIGGFVAGLLASFESEDPDRAIDHMAELLLRTLGVGVEAASRIAHQPLPPLATDNGELS